MTPPRVLRVSGIPAGRYEDDLLLDKIFIHFLSRKNGGNGEVDVRFPTRERGVAMLTFDQVEVVERVLNQRHLLEIQGLTFRLEVGRPQHQKTQFSMPITTNLSLEYFDDYQEVMKVLKKHGLNVCGVENYYLSIEGDFQDLSRCRDELYKIMSHSAHHVENRMSRKDQYRATEYSSDKHHVSGEEAGKQSPMKSLPDKSSNKTSNRDPSPRRSKRTPEPLPTGHDGHSSTGDGSRTPYIKQYLGSVGSSQRRPKDTSSDDPTFIKKHPRSNIAASLNLYPAPPKRLPAYEDRKIGRSSPLPSNVKPADGSGLDGRTFVSTQFRENLPESRHLKENFAAESSSSQSKPKGPIADGFTSNQKYPNSTIGDGSDFNPGQPKNTSTAELNPKHSKNTIVDGTKFNSGEPKNVSREEFNSSQNHSKSANGDGTKFSSGQPKNASTEEFNSILKHSKSTIEGTTKFTSGQPKNTSTDELNPKHSKSTIIDDTKIHYGQPKNVSREEFNSSQNHSKSANGDGNKSTSGQPKNISTDEFNSNLKHSKSTNEGSTKSTSGQPKNTSTDELNPKHYTNTIEGSTKIHYGQPKNASREELNLGQNHSNSSIEGTTKSTSGQAKNTSTDKVNLNSKHSNSVVGDSTKFSSGQPKNSSLDELNLNPKLPKNALGDGANFKPGNPQNSPPDEFYLHARDPEDLTARSSNRSSLMAAGWSSSSSPTSLTTNNPKNYPDPSPISTDFLVDPAAHTYISVFMKYEISNILGQADVEMKTETGDGFSRVILTTKSPHLSQNFYKAAREISGIFMKCQSFLRVENIDLSNISSDVTKKLQTYLFYCGIWSSPNGKRLQMIGPSKDITRFMEKWASTGGDFARLMHLLQLVSPASSRPPVVGRDNVHQSTTGNHNVTHDVHTRRARSRDRREETGARGGGRRPDSISRSKMPSDKPWK